jgi:Arc/MetJ-type ribon-helix-helix transcriptional regulator
MASSTTTTVGVRIKNEHIAVIDELVRLGIFNNRAEAIRFMVTPVYEMLSTAWNSNSKLSAIKARLKSEQEVMGKLNALLKRSDEFSLEGGLEAQPA